MKKWGQTPFLVLLMMSSAAAQECRVLDPELQDGYVGPCVNGLAEGTGSAIGTAQYRGGFKAGRKHGKGVKRWPNGDRYEGEFATDMKHGTGVYVWGRGPWAGERYEGAFANDRRHGFGTYRWQTGDVYAGPWKDDAAVGAPTAMMQARARFEREALAAVGKPGQTVCRPQPVGYALRQWVRGVVVAVEGNEVAVNTNGAILRDKASAWTPCF